jgi:flagellar protein FliS
MMTNPYEIYKHQSVMTMTSGQILLLVYNELIKQLSLAQKAFEKNDIPEINRSLQKAQVIIRELKGTLNFDYSISSDLNNLYDFFYTAVLNANMKKDASALPSIIEMANEMRSTFAEAEKLARD